MAKIKPIYLIGAAAIAAYYFRDKLFGSAAPGSDGQELTDTEIKTPDAVIDVKNTGGSVDQAISTAKKIAAGYKDIKVLIKTPAGQKNIEFTKGKKTPAERKKKRVDKRLARKKRRSKKKAQIIIEPTQSSFKPFPQD